MERVKCLASEAKQDLLKSIMEKDEMEKKIRIAFQMAERERRDMVVSGLKRYVRIELEKLKKQQSELVALEASMDRIDNDKDMEILVKVGCSYKEG